MVIHTLGEEREHTISFINDFTIDIEFDGGDGYWDSSRYYAEQRRIRLYNDKKELIAELVEKNPHQMEHETRVKEHLKKLGYPKPNTYESDPNKIDVIF